MHVLAAAIYSIGLWALLCCYGLFTDAAWLPFALMLAPFVISGAILLMIVWVEMEDRIRCARSVPRRPGLRASRWK